MTVVLDTKPVGTNFARVGIVRALRKGGRKGRILATADDVRPFDMTSPALEDARRLAIEHGWSVVEVA